MGGLEKSLAEIKTEQESLSERLADVEDFKKKMSIIE